MRAGSEPMIFRQQKHNSLMKLWSREEVLFSLIVE
ncbi:hypothetical protein HGR_10370 [Hylemonella gracilis ATCC 19624]|uniref:Uncharacterized protein n=1 Tax=Hylemonella gracilis ATCC 19624 TaxID=887062 RepID=F3KUE0_9BURK|nr:hypothetical protein HGR_10370 [Hylemonella gracilis ATCC 19624]